MNWYLVVLKKYAVFTGRARRKEYWYFFLFSNVIIFVLAVIGGMSGTFINELNLRMLVGIYAFAALIPSMAVAVRRLHDIGLSGWWLLLGLVPIIGGIVLLVLTVQDSKPGENQYGFNPKGVFLEEGVNRTEMV